jgi:hypothetical protein
MKKLRICCINNKFVHGNNIRCIDIQTRAEGEGGVEVVYYLYILYNTDANAVCSQGEGRPDVASERQGFIQSSF